MSVYRNVQPAEHKQEEINFAYEGGLYVELIHNRSFKPDAVMPRVTPGHLSARHQAQLPDGTRIPKHLKSVSNVKQI